MDNTSLYERLGGAHGIDVIVEEIVAAHLDNPLIGPRFRPYTLDPERFAEIKGHLRMFLITGSGGPGSYEGRTMPETHRGMNISVAEYMAAVDDIMMVLAQNDVPESAQKDVLAITYALKGEIVHH